ncbi:MAG: prepilin-type N-terminal cleavage/methylation domain-containing protein [Planctomycetes bacterium]|nr:prepilin-type N-terminal cleavage/methylation domain-containing protein [Planctomycetota bacterium]
MVFTISNPHARRTGFTLLEALVAMVILALVASSAAVGLGLSSAAQHQARLTQLAMQAAQQQVQFLMEKPYDSMSDHAVVEPVGTMLAPPAAGGVERTSTLGGAWSGLGRRTTLTDEPLTFSQFNAVRIEGTRIEIEVFGPDGTIYASIRRHRTRETES